MEPQVLRTVQSVIAQFQEMISQKTSTRGLTVVNCPNCGTKVATMIEFWTGVFPKDIASGYLPEFRVGAFECPKCKAKFKLKVSATSKPDKTNVEDLIIRIKEIQQGFTRTLMVLREKIMILETEQASLLEEIEQLKRAAESRASALEAEVKRLREELRLLREFLDVTE